MTKKVKLSSTQIWVIEEIIKHGPLRQHNGRGGINYSSATSRRLKEIGVCEYDYEAGGLVLTKMGKTYQL